MEGNWWTPTCSHVVLCWGPIGLRSPAPNAWRNRIVFDPLLGRCLSVVISYTGWKHYGYYHHLCYYHLCLFCCCCHLSAGCHLCSLRSLSAVLCSCLARILHLSLPRPDHKATKICCWEAWGLFCPRVWGCFALLVSCFLEWRALYISLRHLESFLYKSSHFPLNRSGLIVGNSRKGLVSNRFRDLTALSFRGCVRFWLSRRRWSDVT